ncbi:MAG: polysaccharide deacetylase family protein [Syntrophaceae bacterium]|nr:polysaccharide deacetylase family protein [Syntrophaceae bacterium]
MDPVLGLKIDVDTYQGMKNGVPRLLDILGDFGLKGTFFLSIGPDASGRALLQLLKNPRFLKKMLRTNAPGLYGFRTALYGTLLPSPMIALSFPGLVRRILDEGHEVQFHAWDHRRWQDDLAERSREWIEDWFEKGTEEFRSLTGRRPTAFGAPSWRVDDRVLEILGRYRFEYLSCTRAAEPFLYEGLGIPEIPSDLPCFEEAGVEGGTEAVLSALRGGGLHVLPVHAEAEGGIWDQPFIFLLEQFRAKGCRVATLDEIRRDLDTGALPRRNPRLELLPGRAFPCAV